MPGYDDEEPEVLFLDDIPTDTDIYGNVIRPPEWAGEVDGEELVEFLLSGETE